MATRLPSTVETTDQLVPLKFWMLDPPTTQTSVGETASTAREPPPTEGRFESALHVVPLNCRICSGLPFAPVLPTAKMSVLETAEMPDNRPSVENWEGA